MMTESDGSYLCTACGWIYEPSQGDPDGGIAPDTRWERIPDDWVCPVCGAGKSEFEPTGPAQPHPVREETGPTSTVVIVGSGLAGYSVAKELRRRDQQTPIVVLTADGGEAYSKPMLSNALARHHQPDDLVQKDAADMAGNLSIEVRTRTRVLAIDRDTRRVTLGEPDGSATLAYDRLVLALGADPRVFPAEGSAAVGIATVNDLDDYRRWRAQISPGDRILLIGAGLIGCEFANDLAGAGFPVTLVDPAPWPLSRLLPEAIGRLLVHALEGVGCTLYMGRAVSRYQTQASGFLAELDDGSRIGFDHALSAVGLTPRTQLAAAAGLKVRAGIVTDRLLRTSDASIFALGDCAETPAGPLPFIAPLLAQARALAATLAGEETPLRLPALPVVVKTPALPLVVCPPHPGTEGTWEVELGEHEATALFRRPDGSEAGFVLAGASTSRQQAMAKRMPDLLPEQAGTPPRADEHAPTGAPGGRYECDVCGYVYDPEAGDPDGGIAPGTVWEELSDDWVCPQCGAGKDEFSKIT